LYLYIQGDDQTKAGKAYAIVAKVKTAAWEYGRLWLDTLDYICDKDQHFPTTLKDGAWHKPVSKSQAEPDWLDTTQVFVVSILDGLNQDKKLSARDARRALTILNRNQDDHPHAADFIARLLEKRPAKVCVSVCLSVFECGELVSW
jgi:hypothetical protein